MSGTGVITLKGSVLGGALQGLITSNDIGVGEDPSYELCKALYLYHPLGGKLVELPITLAMSQPRVLSVKDGPEELIVAQFEKVWEAFRANDHIFNCAVLARVYGVSSIIYGAKDTPTNQSIDPWELPNLNLYFNVYDPLNTSGSLVPNQDPNSPDFQKVVSVTVSGDHYHRSRCVVHMNEMPVYIAYTASAYGYVGRSVFQRILFPLKSFIQTMRADDMVARKAGVLIAMMRQAGSIIDNLMQKAMGIKRSLLKEAETDNVLTIALDEKIETLNMQNVGDALTTARKNILENIASGSDGMPAVLINSETFAQGFSAGSEDAKYVAKYIDAKRTSMRPLYDFFDPLVMHAAWNEEFYKSIQAAFPEYEKMSYKEAFYKWKASFKATWPSLLTEPDSEKVNVDKTKMESIISILETLAPQMDPENKVKLLQWAVDNLNQNELIFQTPLSLDWEALRDYTPPDLGEAGGGEGGGANGEVPGTSEPKAPPPKKLAAVG